MIVPIIAALWLTSAPLTLRLPAYPLSVPDLIIQESLLNGMDPSLPLAVAWRESRFNALAWHRNADHSIDFGVMGLNSHTVKVLHVAHPLNARQSIIAGVGLLAVYMDQFHGNKAMALCAYAHGPERCLR